LQIGAIAPHTQPRRRRPAFGAPPPVMKRERQSNDTFSSASSARLVGQGESLEDRRDRIHILPTGRPATAIGSAMGEGTAASIDEYDRRIRFFDRRDRHRRVSRCHNAESQRYRKCRYPIPSVSWLPVDPKKRIPPSSYTMNLCVARSLRRSLAPWTSASPQTLNHQSSAFGDFLF
jgi:hypothetical protein